MTTEKSKLIAVGIDCGSLNARVSIQTSSETIPSIVPNEIGQRQTITLAAPEPEIEDDPLNDQYWDNSNHSSSKGGNKKSDQTKIKFLVGDSARKNLNRLKKPLDPHHILNMMRQLETLEQTQDSSDLIAASSTFFHHLVNLTSHAAHVHSQHLRFVLSVPYTFDSRVSNRLITAVQSGIMESIKEAGIDKREKKSISEEHRILSLISHPIAIAHAHNLLSHSYSNALIVDWGASALSISHVNIQLGGIACIQKHSTETQLSGKKIIHLLVQHIAELFERKVRGAIPPGETLMNKKAKAKLEIAAEDAIRSFGFSPKVTVTIDGLIDGLDCHVDVMLARFEMIMGDILRRSESFLSGYATDGVDAVLVAGNVVRMKCVEKMLDRIFPSDNFWRGEGVTSVPPEEAVAMGCALYSNICILSNEYSCTQTNCNEKKEFHLEEEVLLSPIGIGLSFQEGDPAAQTLIEPGSALPVLVTKLVDLALCSSDMMSVVQITGEGEKVIGRINGFDQINSKEMEITTELTVDGSLFISVNGASPVQF
jgi:molecular chaperone DnaK (HSP70)